MQNNLVNQSIKLRGLSIDHSQTQLVGFGSDALTHQSWAANVLDAGVVGGVKLWGEFEWRWVNTKHMLTDPQLGFQKATGPGSRKLCQDDSTYRNAPWLQYIILQKDHLNHLTYIHQCTQKTYFFLNSVDLNPHNSTHHVEYKVIQIWLLHPLLCDIPLILVLKSNAFRHGGRVRSKTDFPSLYSNDLQTCPGSSC